MTHAGEGVGKSGQLRRDRDSLVIATKGGINPGGERPRETNRSFPRQGVEQSLRALDVDYIDPYQVHWPDADTPAEETAGALQELVDEGRIRHIGVSNYNAAQMAHFQRTRPVEPLQPRTTCSGGVSRTTSCPTLVSTTSACWPTARWPLTGTMTEHTTFEAGDWRASATAFKGEALRRNLVVVDRLAELAKLRGITVS